MFLFLFLHFVCELKYFARVIVCMYFLFAAYTSPNASFFNLFSLLDMVKILNRCSVASNCQRNCCFGYLNILSSCLYSTHSHRYRILLFGVGYEILLWWWWCWCGVTTIFIEPWRQAHKHYMHVQIIRVRLKFECSIFAFSQHIHWISYWIRHVNSGPVATGHFIVSR